MNVGNKGLLSAASIVAVVVFLLATPSSAKLHGCFLDHSPDAFNPKHEIKPAMAGHSLLVEFRARADEFGMNVGSPEWDEMVDIINTYEIYYETQMAIVDGYRDTLEEEELSEAEMKSIMDEVHNILKALDYRFIEDGFACRALIPDDAWASYEIWFIANH
jgi:hypothetical protein